MKIIPLMTPNIIEKDIEFVSEVLRSKNIVQGEKVRLFENKIANYIGVKEAIAVSNGTASLHLCLIALGIGIGDEVIIPAFSYVATANVVEIVGATPVFVDVEIDTFNINIGEVENKITKKTKAIIPVHEFGLACDIHDLTVIANKHGIPIIEDAACALGAKENNKMVGSFGLFGSFSFHPRKAITSGEGGIITTNNTELAEKLRALRNHGIQLINNEFKFLYAGYNYRMTDFQAALLISQFERFNDNLSKRKEIASYYLTEINNTKFTLPTYSTNKNPTWQTFHILCNKLDTRDKIIDLLSKQGVQSNYGAQCIPFVDFYKQKYNFNCTEMFPNALSAFLNGLAIPLYELLSEDQIKHIVDQLNKI